MSNVSGLEKKIAFGFSICKGYIDDTDEISPYLRILIGVVYPPIFNYEWAETVFYYRGYDFYFDGIFLDSLLTKTNEFIVIPCIDPKKYQHHFHNRGDKDMFWWYEYRDDQIINLSWGHCNEE